MAKPYVHGYSREESRRLTDQAGALSELLHHDSLFPRGSAVLEAGCGVGAQTGILAKKNPRAKFISMDISAASVSAAQASAKKAKLRNVEFVQGDIFHLPFADESFDHIFVCFVLEHLPDPVRALSHLKRVLKKGGTITVIEGDHGSAMMYPESEYARRAIRCLIDLQAEAKGNALIGRSLYPVLRTARFRDITVSPRFVYSDKSRPRLQDEFVRKTFTAMVKGVAQRSRAGNMMPREEWDFGIRDLCRAAGPDGTFSYTFFKARAVK